MPLQEPKIRKYSDKADAFLALRQYARALIAFLQQEFEEQLFSNPAVNPLHIVIAVSSRLNRLLVTIPDLEYNHQTGSCKRLELMAPIRFYFDALCAHIDELIALKSKLVPDPVYNLHKIISSVEITQSTMMLSYDGIPEYNPCSCTERIAFGRDIGESQPQSHYLIKITPRDHLPQPSLQGYIANCTGDMKLDEKKYTHYIHMMHCPAPSQISFKPVGPKKKTTTDEDMGFGLFD